MDEVITQSPNIEQPEPGFKYIGFWRRFGAFIIDLAILMAIGSVLRLIINPGASDYGSLQLLLNMDNPEFLTEAQEFNKNQGPLIGLISLAINLGYYALFYVNHNGATPGKRALGAKLVNEDGGAVTYAQVIIRYVLSFVSLLFVGLGYFWVAFNKKKQAWHDIAAKTYVIEDRPIPTSGYILSIFVLVFILGYFGLFITVGVLSVTKTVKDTTDPIEKVIETRNSYESELRELETAEAYVLSEELLAKVRDSDDSAEITSLTTQRIDLLLDVIEQYPDNSAVYYKLAGAYTWTNDRGTLSDSIDNYEKAIELNPDNYLYYRDLSTPYQNSGDYTEAILQLKKSLAIKSNTNPLSYYKLGNSYAALGINDKALESYETAEEQYEKLNTYGDFDETILLVQIAKAKLN